jgi:hypothetical protein
MIRFIYGDDDAIRDFIAQREGLPRGLFAEGKGIGIVNERNEFLAGFFYHHWNPEAGTIVMSGTALSTRWMSRSVLKRLFDYPFYECKCQMLMIQLRASDERMKRQLAVGGFGFTTIARLYGRGEDGIIATMYEEDWRASKFNKTARTALLEEAA